MSTSFTGLTCVLQAIDDLVHICSRHNWDGYGAQPLSLEAAAAARAFLRALSPDLAAKADVGVEPDGWLSMEWYATPDVLVSFSFGPGDRVVYAWRNGRVGQDSARLGSGNFKFHNVIHKEIAGLIAQIYYYDQRPDPSHRSDSSSGADLPSGD